MATFVARVRGTPQACRMVRNGEVYDYTEQAALGIVTGSSRTDHEPDKSCP